MSQNEHLIDSLSIAVIALDRQRRIVLLNLAAESMLSCSRRIALGQRINKICPLPDSLISQIDDVILNRQTLITRQLQIPTRNLQTAIVDCIVSPMEDNTDNAQEPQVLLELIDIDRQHKIAQERALYEQQERSQRMLRGVAHEVLNPLGGIRGAAQLLEQELGRSKLTDYTGLLIKEADRLQNLMQKMLGPNKRPEISANNIHEILDYVSQLLLTENRSNVRTKTDYDPSIPHLLCDREKLVQVFINLFSNALHALSEVDITDTPDNSPMVTLRTRVERNFTIRGQLKKLICKVQVIDNGVGLDPELKDTLFFPLVSGRPNGTGLGLSIAQSLVVQHGGLIECHSQPGHTVFEVTLPLDESKP